MGKILYVPGQVLNEAGTQYVKDIKSNNQKHRKVLAKCPCGEFFEGRVDNIKNNNSVCRKCSNKRKQNNYKAGSVINKETGTVFLERTKCDSHGEWSAKFVCGKCRNIYETRISRAKAGSLCKKCREQSIKDAKTIYKPGDILQSKNDCFFKFIEETPPQKGVRTSRCGIFIKVNSNGNEVGESFYSQIGHVISGECTGSKKSNGEEFFANALDVLSIPYKREYAFKDLISDTGNLLRFDFAIPYNDKTILVELNGKQHYFPVEFFGGEENFKRLQEHDKLKEQYVNSHENLYLEKILYTDYNKINVEYVKNFLHKVIADMERM